MVDKQERTAAAEEAPVVDKQECAAAAAAARLEDAKVATDEAAANLQEAQTLLVTYAQAFGHAQARQEEAQQEYDEACKVQQDQDDTAY